MRIIIVLTICVLHWLSSASNDVVEEPHPGSEFTGHKIRNWRPSSNEEGTWIEGPFGNLYQFHVGDQSWLSARERCLALDSDLVTIHYPEQLAWIVSHYPLHHGASSLDRAVQIGLIYESHNGEEDWRWVDGKTFNASLLEWRKSTAANTSQLETRCAMMRLHELKLEDVRCDVAASFDRTNRFICERTQKRHLKHLQSSFPIWREFEQIMRLLGFNNATIAETTTSSMVQQHSIEMSEAAGVTAGTVNEERDRILSALNTSALIASESGATEELDFLLYNATDQTSPSLVVLTKIANNTENTNGKYQNSEEVGMNVEPQITSRKINNSDKGEEGSDEENKQIVHKALDYKSKELQEVSSRRSDNEYSSSEGKIKQALDSSEKSSAKATGQVIKTIEDEIAENKKLIGLVDNKNIVIEEQGIEGQSSQRTMSEDGFVEDSNVAKRLEEDFKDTIKEDVPENEQQFCEDEPEHKTSSSRDEKINEFFGALSKFLRRAERRELRELLDHSSGSTGSSTLTERLKAALVRKHDEELRELKSAVTKKRKGDQEHLKPPSVPESQQQQHHYKLVPNDFTTNELESIAFNILHSVDRLLQLESQVPDEKANVAQQHGSAILPVQHLTPSADAAGNSSEINNSLHEARLNDTEETVSKGDKSQIKETFMDGDKALDEKHKNESLSSEVMIETKDQNQSNDEFAMTDENVETNSTSLKQHPVTSEHKNEQHSNDEEKQESKTVPSIKLSRLSNSFQIPTGITWNSGGNVDRHEPHTQIDQHEPKSISDSASSLGMQIIEQNLSDRVQKLLNVRKPS